MWPPTPPPSLMRHSAPRRWWWHRPAARPTDGAHPLGGRCSTTPGHTRRILQRYSKDEAKECGYTKEQGALNHRLWLGMWAHVSRARGCANYGPKSMRGCELRLYKVGLIFSSTAWPFLNIIHSRAFSRDQQVLAGTVFTAPCSCITRGDTALQSQPDGPLRAPAKAASPTPPLPCSAQLAHHDRMKRSGGSGKRRTDRKTYRCSIHYSYNYFGVIHTATIFFCFKKK